MIWWELLIVAVALGTDAFSVAIVAGSIMPKITFRPVFRLSFHFGLFQFLMPIIGWYGGSSFAGLFGDIAPYIAAGLLFFVSAKMFYEALRRDDSEKHAKDMSRGFSLIMLSVATSIDALVVGIGLGILGGAVFFNAVIIGVVASSMTLVGIFIGKKIKMIIGGKAEILGAIALAVIAASIILR